MKQPMVLAHDFGEQPDKVVPVGVVPDNIALLVTTTGNVPQRTGNLEAKWASQDGTENATWPGCQWGRRS